MDFYFTDRKFNLLGIASTSTEAPIAIYNDQDIHSIMTPLEHSKGRLFFRLKNEIKSNLWRTMETTFCIKMKMANQIL